jgi:hypothetical protein
MRTVKLLTAILNAFVGAWLLILTDGIFVAMEGAHPDWYPVPSHPVARIVLYLTIGIGLQFLSSWLMPASPETVAAYWRPLCCAGDSLRLWVFRSRGGNTLCCSDVLQ